MYIVAARDAPDSKDLLDDVEGWCKELLKRDPNSFDGHRLMGDLDLARAMAALKVAQKDTAQVLLDSAIVEYRKANTIKPDQQAVLMQLARTVSGKGDYVTAEQYYHQILDKDKTFQPAYTELYKLYLFTGKPADAENLLKRAFQDNPKQYQYLVLLASQYSAQKRPADMVAVLDQIKSHAKDFSDAYLWVGDFYFRLGNSDAAIREYR